MTADEPRIYQIVRYRQSGRKRILHKGVTLSVAQLHCNDPRTKGKGWFDGYEYIRGWQPKTAEGKDA